MNKFKKQSSGANATPTLSDLARGELALNTNDGLVFFKNSADNLTPIDPLDPLDGRLVTLRSTPVYHELADITARDELTSNPILNEGDWVRYLHGAYYRIEMWYNGKWFLVEEEPPKFLMVVTMLSIYGPSFKNVVGGALSIVEKANNHWEISSPDEVERIQFDQFRNEVLSVFMRVSNDLTSMESMFEGCSNLNSGNITRMNTSNVITMKAAFKGCISLTGDQDLPFNAGKVTDMSSMFEGCSSLTSARLSFTFATAGSIVQDTSRMFLNCTALECISHVNTTADGIGSADDLCDKTDIFSGCPSLINPNSTSRDDITDPSGGEYVHAC